MIHTTAFVRDIHTIQVTDSMGYTGADVVAFRLDADLAIQGPLADMLRVIGEAHEQLLAIERDRHAGEVVDAVIHAEDCESATCDGECDFFPDPMPRSPIERTLDAMAAEDAAECGSHNESTISCPDCGDCRCDRATDVDTGKDAGIAEVRGDCPVHGGEPEPAAGESPPDLRLIEGEAEPVERPPRQRPAGAGLRIERRDWSSEAEPWRIVAPDGLELGGARTKAKAVEVLGDLCWQLHLQAQLTVLAQQEVAA